MTSMLQPNEYENVPNILLDRVSAFADSLEYALLTERERTIPGVVCAAFTRFLVHVHSKTLRTDRDERTLRACYEAIEALSASSSSEVVNVVVTEIFENLDCHSEALKEIQSQLGPQSRALYDRWMS